MPRRCGRAKQITARLIAVDADVSQKNMMEVWYGSLYMDSSVVSVVYGRGMVTGVTPKIYPAARDTLVNGRRTVTRVTDQFHSAANLVTEDLHTRFYIRDPPSCRVARGRRQQTG